MANKSVAEKSRISLPLVLLIALIPLLGGLLWYLENVASRREPVPPPPITAEAKGYVGNLKLSGVDMKATANYAGAAVVEITGQITNTGDRVLDRVELNCVFFDTAGLVVFRERVPIVKSTMKPGETKAFRLPFEGIPDRWNQALPQLVIAQVAFAG